MNFLFRSSILPALPFLLLLFLHGPAGSTTLLQEEAGQDSLEAKRSGYVFYPIIYYTPETELAFGATLSYIFRESGSCLTSRPSFVMPILIYTINNQFISKLDTDLSWKDELYHFKGSTGFQKYPGKFYGIGNNTSEKNEEEYTRRFTQLSASFQKRLWRELRAGLSYEFEHNTVVEMEEDGLFAAGEVPGVGGGSTSGLGFIVNWDTRDNIFFPTSGSHVELSTGFYGSTLAGDHTYDRFSLDLRRYCSFSGSHVLAFHGSLNFLTGEPPFNKMSQLGGEDMMRGYYQGRFRDRHLMAFQAEYRSPRWKRIGFVLFAGVGDVAHRAGDFRLDEFKGAAGWGLRYMIHPDECINLRLDLGWGKDSFGVYMKILEAF